MAIDEKSGSERERSSREEEEERRFKLVGHSRFVRSNPRSDRFGVKGFHHVEFWCTDATNVSRRFSWGLGLPLVAKSDLSTGNSVHASYLLRSHHLRFLFSAPYYFTTSSSSASIPSFDHRSARSFSASHGLAVRAIALLVDDADHAFRASVSHGARPSFPPTPLVDSTALIAEVHLYGDVVLRYLSGLDSEPVFLPGFESLPLINHRHHQDERSEEMELGLRRVDHAVGNVWKLEESVSYVKSFTGFHEFAEFVAEDVGTAESGLNSAVLANNEETVLLPMNEPVYGTKRKSQIQTYLEHNEGEGVQHLALATNDIFRTLRGMRRRGAMGGFEFMPAPPPTYYSNLRKRAGDVLSEEQMSECEELGVLVDRDDQGTLLQIFTKPIGDRPTMFLEIIQRVGCIGEDGVQKGGCGGFGKGNFSELFKSIEDYEKTLEPKSIDA
ncbi:hypothetical protein Scep_027212 [Stephania cephalantha]|uniref:4-hydroxyphenylpyruvate dioxygenase n=1 Tax=Stephania cephalantha TaxID=152367 RepID=A0AAP0E9Y2_9MAGN